MRVLLDTCVLSELRRTKGDPGVRIVQRMLDPARAVDALDDEDLFVSVVSIREIAKGIALLKESQNKRALLGWLAGSRPQLCRPASTRRS